MTTRENDFVSLMTAFVSGDASREEVSADLRQRNLDALDVLLELVKETARQDQDRRSGGQRGTPVDIQSVFTRSGPDAPESIHHVPRCPVRVRGTVYDPADLPRFNGTELHFVNTGADELLALDDRSFVENLWKSSYLASLARCDRASALEVTPDAASIGTQRMDTGRLGALGFSSASAGAAAVAGPCVVVPAPAPAPHTNFYEHTHRGGDRLELASGSEMLDFRDFHLGWIFSGHDWNDKPSSIEMVRTEGTVVWEHTHKRGSSFTTFTSVVDLHAHGWGDRTSSAVTWGATPWFGMTTYCGPWG